MICWDLEHRVVSDFSRAISVESWEQMTSFYRLRLNRGEGAEIWVKIPPFWRLSHIRENKGIIWISPGASVLLSLMF